MGVSCIGLVLKLHGIAMPGNLRPPLKWAMFVHLMIIGFGFDLVQEKQRRSDFKPLL